MTAVTKKTVLVTGAGGFIGSHLVEQLLDSGWRVRALVRYTSQASVGNLRQRVSQLVTQFGQTSLPDLGSNATAFGPLELVWGDITDATLVRRCCDDVYAICHLGALIGIPYSYVAPVSYVDVNIGGTLNLLEAARSARVPRFIQTSTSEVYGTARYTPIDLNHPLQAQSPYAATKIAADKLAESYARSFGMDVLVLRPFNTYGPRQSFRAVIPTIIGQALRGDTVILGNTTTVRDFTFVRDTCRAFLLALEQTVPTASTVHLGTGTGVTAGDLVEAIGKVIGRKLRVEVANERLRPKESEVEVLISDPSAASSMLGWSPEIRLEDGLAQTVEWFRAESVGGGEQYCV